MTSLRFVAPLLLVGSLEVLVGLSTPALAAPGVLINEVVTDPQRDWNESSGGNGVPFDDVPGTGTVSGQDEWVEIVNVSASVVDLTGWTLEMRDSSPATLNLSSPGTTFLVFSPGSSLSAFQPGGRLVLGDVPGDMQNSVYLVLRNASAVVIDDLEVGDDWEGDGNGDGAPAPGENGDATGVADEAVARVPNAVDTNDDVADFVKQAATIGAPNSDPPLVLINEVVTDPQRDWNESSGGDGTLFNDVPGSGTIDSGDEWIELYNASSSTVNLSGWSLHLLDATPDVLNLGAPGGTILRYSAGSSPTAFLAGGYLVIGNPPGAMANQVYLELRDPFGAVADDVEIGDDPEGDGPGDGAPGPGQDGDATGIADESVARVPSGTDTDDDVADFTRGEATIGKMNTATVSVSPAPAVGPDLDVSYSMSGTARMTLLLPEACRVDVSIHDVTGRRFFFQSMANVGPGAESFSWSPRRSGVYWVRVGGRGIESGRPVHLVRRMTVVR